MYDYKEAVKEDVKQFIYDNYTKNEIKEKIENRSKFEETLNEVLWDEDSITGITSGSYTFNTLEAKENLSNNWGLLEDACYEFGADSGEIFKQGAEACDVTIRCYLLSGAISEALDEIEENE